MLGKGLESLIPKKNNQGDDQSSRSFGNQNYQHQNQPSHHQANQEPISVIKEDIFMTDKDIDNIPTVSGPIFHIEVEKVILNPYQPRKEFDEEALRELASSIREFGILQPLVVSKIEEETEIGTKVTYQLIAGQRRLMASKLLGLRTVPVIIRNFLKKTEALEMAIVENIQRADLNIIETARAYSRLSDEFGLTQREIAARLGKSREMIANALRLLALPSEVQQAVSHGQINESQARLLLQIEDPQQQLQLFNKIITENLSVRDLKKHILGASSKSGSSLLDQEKPLTAEDIEFKSFEKDLSEFLGAPVKMEFSRSGGKIVIHFYSPEEARGIVHKMRKEENNEW